MRVYSVALEDDMKRDSCYLAGCEPGNWYLEKGQLTSGRKYQLPEYA
jgi:hypothetical protein